MPPDGFDGVERILAIRPDNIGDVVMLGPALRALRVAFPEAEITLFASPAGAQAAPLLPWVDAVVVHRPVWQDVSGALPLSPVREQALVEGLRERRFDAALIFTSFSQSPYPPAYVSYLAGIPVRVGQARDFGGSLLTHGVKPPPDEVNQAERNLHLLEGVGFAIRDRSLELAVPEEADAAAVALLDSRGLDPDAPFVALAPGASCDARRYDPARYGAVASLLAAETGLPLVLLAGGRERDLAECVLAAADDAPLVSLAGETSVPELAATVARASLVVCNNSACLHFAGAFRRPVVCTYAGTDLEEQWRPLRTPSVLLRRPTWCSPCFRFECPYDKECLDIPPAEIVQAALSLLEPRGAASVQLP